MKTWIIYYECPICGDISSKPLPECPFCHTKLENNTQKMDKQSLVKADDSIKMNEMGCRNEQRGTQKP